MEEDTAILRNSEAVRRRRLNKVRTPTAVVSEVFGFLNEVSSETADDDDELIMSDGEVDQLFSNLDVGMDEFDRTNIEDCVNSSVLFNNNEQDKFLAEVKSKDSGFASLERQRCEPSSLYDSFLENDDDTEDAFESVYSNDIITSISESLYDDVDVTEVPRSISMEGKSTYVDDETENAIASSAEKFEAELGSFDKMLSETGSIPNHDDVTNNGQNATTRVGDITVIMVNNPSVDNVVIYDENHQKSPVSFQTDDKSMVTFESSTDTTKKYVKSEDDDDSIDVACDSIIPSFSPHKYKTENMFEFVMKTGEVSPNFVQSSADNNYNISPSNAASREICNFEQECETQVEEICESDNRTDIVGDVNYIVDHCACSTSSDDGDEDIRDSDYITNAVDQAYDTIDIDSHGDGVNKDAAVVVGNEDSLSNGGKVVLAESSLKDLDAQSSVEATTPLSEKSPFNLIRRHKLEKNPSAEMASDDSSDEDVGIYAESFRRSNWFRLSQEGKIEIKTPDLTQLQSSNLSTSTSLMLTSNNVDSCTTDNADVETPFSPTADEVFNEQLSEVKMMHKRTDSMTTTASETEFKHRYVSRRKCLIQRADSQQEYHRLSSRVYDQDKQVIVQRTTDSEDLGLHLLDSHPAFITSIDPGSAADKAGITEGQILVSVNDQNVLTTDHADIVELIHSLKGDIKLGVANSDFQPVRDLQATVMSGYMYKLGNSAFKLWKKRYFTLRQDNCLYYYKNEQEHDPLGALPLGGYTISRHTDTSKDFCFKAEKYGGRTYYFIADNRDQMTEWVGALTEAAARSKKRKESFLSVSSHNVGLPALHIVKPECAGFLGKLSPSKRAWRRRYCVLKDACVYYYKDKNSVSALGVAHLHGYTVDVENYQRRKFSFALQPPEQKMRVFYFNADNETDKKRWVESLIHSIQRWVRVDKEFEC